VCIAKTASTTSIFSPSNVRVALFFAITILHYLKAIGFSL
jgi:hypothetical protein